MNYLSPYIIAIIGFFSLDVCCQELSINETLEYLNYTINDDLLNIPTFLDGDREIQLSVSDNCNLHIKYFWKNNQDALFYEYLEKKLDYNEFIIPVNEISKLGKCKFNQFNCVTMHCLDGSKNCIKVPYEAIMWNYGANFSDRPKARNHFDYVHLFYLSNKQNQSKVYNALSYLRTLLDLEKKRSEDKDHFLNTNSNRNKLRRETVNLRTDGGIYYLEIELGGIRTKAYLDSGASSVSIPKNIENKLLQQGIINEKNYGDPVLMTIADGSVYAADRFIIPTLILEGVEAYNVTCTVNSSEDIVLLGQAFLGLFKTWKIDNELNELILEY